MHPNTKKVKVLIGQYYGQHLHTLVTKNVDESHKQKAEEVRIAKQAVVTTVDSIRVKSLREMEISGGIKVTAINGDANAPLKLTDQQVESIVKKASEYNGETEGVRNIFGNFGVACDIANESNDAEIVRLALIRDDIDAQITALKTAKEANNRARAQFESEND